MRHRVHECNHLVHGWLTGRTRLASQLLAIPALFLFRVSCLSCSFFGTTVVSHTTATAVRSVASQSCRMLRNAFHS